LVCNPKILEKMNKIVKYTVLVFAVITMSCKDLLEVTPRQSLDTSTALNTQDGINAAVSSAYANLKGTTIYGRDLLAIAECLGDNVRVIDRAGGRFVSEGQNVINVHLGGWGIYYRTINEINLILKALPTSTFTQVQKDGIEGEMKFLRALMYFNLSRIYSYEPKVIVAQVNKGGVPLLLDGIDAPSQISFPTRAAVADVYAQIYKDLTDAVIKAPASGGPNKATKAAANALFARVALYNQDYENAIKYSTDALAGGVGRFVGNNEYVAAWRSNSNPESIFEVLFQTRQESLGVNNALQSAYTSIGSVSQASALAASRPSPLPVANGWGAVVPTTPFLALNIATDARRGLYQDGLNRSGVVATECTKFLGKSGVVYMDNVPVIRVSEMYLIRAEAYARLATPNLTAALADINTIRVRAGLVASTATTQTAVITEMETQRRLELAFEGHRWFDLKRWGRDVIKTTGNVAYGDTRTIAPIPNSEIIANKNLVQNAGY
jgi:starch-binding outer membrane protein, SusD/RagB family